ncbi:hypothetical protein K2173_003678 [Erythroxylum novogranatense]|uniref:Uncharacterized protein n=1 Tax=Erythroxylum novogranatense TaxID=1862640 RepID=A0AAV8TAS6_9ROSI|nr:hypothetical protein K2173_003678 [Erythroxylum novogranatense]
MGCFFLGCFGFSSKRKRRKPPSKVLFGDKRIGNYEPLDNVSSCIDQTEVPTNSDSEIRKKPKESLNCKIRKKVSFNLNVQAYEPIPAEESDEEEKKENTGESASSIFEGDSNGTKLASYPQNYRYRNCLDSYSEEDEISFEESDLDDDDGSDGFDGDDWVYDGDIDHFRLSVEEISRQLKDSQKRDSSIEEATELSSLVDSNQGALGSLGFTPYARNRGQYVHSVLNPVENLSQWKAMKARSKLIVKDKSKENLTLEQQATNPFISTSNISQSRTIIQEIPVDSSLSNWLVFPDTCKLSAESTTKSINPVEAIPAKGAVFDSTYSWRNRDDMPILDITNLEAR